MRPYNKPVATNVKTDVHTRAPYQLVKSLNKLPDYSLATLVVFSRANKKLKQTSPFRLVLVKK